MRDWNAVPVIPVPDPDAAGPAPRAVVQRAVAAKPAPPLPDPSRATAMAPPAPGAEPERIREEVSTLLLRIDAEPGVSTELFEAAHEVLLRALGTVDRA